MDKPILYEYFDKKAKELLAKFESSSQQKSSNNLGKNREHFLNSFLEAVLPPKLRVDSGEIIDADRNRTGQLDTIIVRDDAPSLEFGSENTYLAEGVFAVIEIKSTLNKQSLSEAANTLGAVANLRVPESQIKFGGHYLGRPLRVLFSYTGIGSKSIVNHINQNDWAETFDMVSVLGNGVLARKERLLFTYALDSREKLGKDIWVPSSAASLGFLYYYLIQYGASFSVLPPNFQEYFFPLHDW